MASPWVAMLGWGGDWPQGPVVMGSRPVGALTVALLSLGRLLRRCSPGLKQGPGDGASFLGGLSLLMSRQQRRRQGFAVWSDAWGREAGVCVTQFPSGLATLLGEPLGPALC